MEPVKRRRVVTSKPSKSGCRTCRIRRVKCDEGRPSCQRCSSTGRICDGYDKALSSSATSNSSGRLLLPADPKIDSPASAVVLASKPTAPLTVRFRVNDYERHAFDYFRLFSAFPVWQISPAKGWVQLALQFGSEDEIIFQAMAAVGAINESLVQITHHSLVRPTDLEKENRALQLYCKTSAALRSRIDDVMVKGGRLEPVLLCCFLFVCFEVMHERGAVALAHLQFGQQVVRNALTAKKTGSDSGSLETKHLSEMQQMLDMFVALAGFEPDAKCTCLPPSITPFQLASHGLDGFPSEGSLASDTFSSIIEAKKALRTLVDQGSQVRRELVRLANEQIDATCSTPLDDVSRYCLAQCLSRDVDLSGHKYLTNKIKHLLDQHTTWLTNFLAVRSSWPNNRQSQQHAALFEIQHFESYFTLLTCRETRETHYDTFLSTFKHILDLATAFLSSVSQTFQPLPRPQYAEPQLSFSLESGLIPAVHLIAIKCRDHHTRQRASDMLTHCDRREGLHWSRGLGGEHAQKIALLETERAYALSRSHDLSESTVLSQTSSTTASSQGLTPECTPPLHEGLYIPEAARVADIVHAGSTQFNDIRVVTARFARERGPQRGGIEIVVYKHVMDAIALEEVKRVTVYCGRGNAGGGITARGK